MADGAESKIPPIVVLVLLPNDTGIAMGQYWKVIAPFRRETLGHWGKLGECLFMSEPKSLLYLLAKPNQPPPRWAELDSSLALQKPNLYVLAHMS